MDKIIQVKGNTYCIDFGTTFLPLYICNTGAVIIDSGDAIFEDRLSRILDDAHISVSSVLSSHAHPDHIGNHRFLQKKCGAIIYACEYDYYNLKRIIKGPFDKFEHNLNLNTTVEYDKAFTADAVYDNNSEKVEILGETFRLVDLRGHSPMHFGIITPDDVFYVGDALKKKETAYKPTTFIYNENWTEALASIKKLRSFSCSKYVVAHGGILSDVQATADAIEENFFSIIKEIEEIASKPVSFEEIMENLTKRHGLTLYSKRRAILVSKMIEYYLEYEISLGKIKCDYSGYITNIVI